MHYESYAYQYAVDIPAGCDIQLYNFIYLSI